MSENGRQDQLGARHQRTRKCCSAQNDLPRREELELWSIEQRPSQAMLNSWCAQKHQAGHGQYKGDEEDALLRVCNSGESRSEWHCYKECGQKLRRWKQNSQLTEQVRKVSVVCKFLILCFYCGDFRHRFSAPFSWDQNACPCLGTQMRAQVNLRNCYL